MQCQICESQVSERALFCEVCGHRVRRAPQTEPAPMRAAEPAGPAATQSWQPPALTPAPAPPSPVVPREEVAAAIAARTELGDRLEPEVLDTFLDRIEVAVINRVDAQVDARLRGRGVRVKQKENPALPVAICSLIFGIPITAITTSNAGVGGLLIAWLGIAAVNIAVNLRKNDT
ncbi:MAG: hypothetical protein AB7R89_29755 [Dehalococcoidia bacterium]